MSVVVSSLLEGVVGRNKKRNMKNNQFNQITIIMVLFVVVIVTIIFLVNDYRINKIERQLSSYLVENDSLEKQIEELGETIRREVIKQRSQEDLLTDAVSEVAPSVVSIVVTKDVPQLEVVYINPFGNDPFFKDFGVRIPQYRQKGTTEQQVGAGTGFIVSSNGYIITNRHVVDDTDAYYTALLSSGEQKIAQIIYIDDEIDIAILKIDGTNYSSIRLGNSKDLKLGQSVFAIGNALGEYSNSVSIGIISGLDRDLEVYDNQVLRKLEGVIQTDAAINPGNSGGPLVNLKGEVIGVSVAMASAENIGFAIPIDMIKLIIDSNIE